MQSHWSVSRLRRTSQAMQCLQGMFLFVCLCVCVCACMPDLCCGQIGTQRRWCWAERDHTRVENDEDEGEIFRGIWLDNPHKGGPTEISWATSHQIEWPVHRPASFQKHQHWRPEWRHSAKANWLDTARWWKCFTALLHSFRTSLWPRRKESSSAQTIKERLYNQASAANLNLEEYYADANIFTCDQECCVSVLFYGIGHGRSAVVCYQWVCNTCCWIVNQWMGKYLSGVIMYHNDR